MRRQRPVPDAETREVRAPAAGVVPVRARSRDRELLGSLAIVASLLLIAIAKPWGAVAPGPTGSVVVRTTVAPSLGPPATQDVSPEGLAAPICLGAGSWQVASLESWQRHDVRVWRAIEPAASATGPLDPRIPSVPVVAVAVAALGWCAPSFGARKPAGPASVDAWWVEVGGAIPVPLQQVQPELGTTPLAALYVLVSPTAPYPPSDRGHRVWPSGHVVFRWRDEPTGTEAWFAAVLTLLPPPTEAPVQPAVTVGPAR